jgi:hypothetical protein
VREAISRRRRQLLVAREDGDPFGEGPIRRDHRRPALVAVADQIEEQLAAEAIERYEAQLVDIKTSSMSRRRWRRSSSRASRASSRCRTRSATRVKEDPALLFRGLDAERSPSASCRCRSGPARIRTLRHGHPLAARQRVDLRRA